MRLTGRSYNDVYSEEKDKLKGERRKRTEATEVKIAKAWSQASSSMDMPESLNKPSNCHPFRRAKVDDDLRIYWRVNEGVLISHDLVDHKKAKKVYGDVHSKHK